jgi:amino acid transporter
VGGSRLLYAVARDSVGARGVGVLSGRGTPARAVGVVTGTAIFIILLCALAFGATATDTFAWSGSIGTLIILVIYILTTIGAIRLVFVQRKMTVPMWQVIFPILGIALLGYTIYVNLVPYPTAGPAEWFPVVAGGILVLAVLAVLFAPGLFSRVGTQLAESELA